MSAQKREEIAAAEKFSRVFFANSKENLILDRNLKNLDRGEKAVVSTISTNQKILYRRFHRKITQTRLSSARSLGGKTAERELLQSGGGHGATAAVPGTVVMTPEDAVLTKIWKTGSLALQNSPTRQLPLLSPVDIDGGRKQLPALPLKSPLPKVRGSSVGDSSEMSSARNVKSAKSEGFPPKSVNALPLTARSSKASGISAGSSWRTSTAGETLNIRLTVSAKSKRSEKPSPRGVRVQTPTSQREGMSRMTQLKSCSSFGTPRDSPRDVFSIQSESSIGSYATQPRTSTAKTDDASGVIKEKDVEIPPSQENPKDDQPDAKVEHGSIAESSPREDAELRSMSFTNRLPQHQRPKFGRGLNKAVNKREKVNNFGISLSPAVPKTNRAVHQQEENFVIKLLKKQLKKTIKGTRTASQLAKVEEEASAGESKHEEEGPRIHDPEDKAVLTIRPRTAHELSRNSSVPRIGNQVIAGERIQNPGGAKQGGSIVKDNPPLPPPLSAEILFDGEGKGGVAQSPYMRPHNNQFMLASPRHSLTSGSARSKSRALCETQRERIRSARYEVRIRDFCDGLDPYKLDRDRQIKDYYFVSLLPKKAGMTPTATDVRQSSSMTSRRGDVRRRGSDSLTEGGTTVLPSESEAMKYGGDMNIRNMTFKVLNWDFSKNRRRDPTHCK